MSLLTPKQRGRLIANGREIDLVPVCKLFYPAGTGAWLITHADPLEPHRLFGLCHHHDGHTPELGYVNLRYLTRFKDDADRGIERDPAFSGRWPISVYLAAALRAGRIVDSGPELDLAFDDYRRSFGD